MYLRGLITKSFKNYSFAHLHNLWLISVPAERVRWAASLQGL